MADLHISWEIEGEKQLSRRLRGISEDLTEWELAIKKSVLTLKDIFENDVFKTEGQAIGERWSPLSRAYAEQKRQRYGDQPILVATGKMRKSFKATWNPYKGVVWNTAAYFKYHQSNQPRSKIPRRVMMKLGNQQRELIVKNFQELAVKKIRKNT